MMEALPLNAEALDWQADRYQAVYVSRNRWLVTALAALALAAFQAAALVILLPLKTAIPFLIKEETSGAVVTLRPLAGDPSVTYSESLRKYFLARYLIYRETYDPMDLRDNYHSVDLMSGGQESRLFRQWADPSSPSSPIRIYGAQTRRTIRIRSIAFLNSDTAQIRFTATEERVSAPPKMSDWIATLAYRFGFAPAQDAERLVNPLGFSVTHYRIDQEVIP
jgi:type IV secretion system protein VirB8